MEIWRPVDAAAGQLSGITELEALAADFPHSASVRLRLLNAYLQANDLQAALPQIAWLSERGYQFSAGARTQLASMYEGADAEALMAQFDAYAPPLEASETFAIVPVEAHLVEGIAFDPDSGNFAVTTVISPALWRIREGEWKSYPIEDVGNLSGVAVHPSDGIWLASGDLGMLGDGEQSFSGLVNFAFDPAGAVRFPAPSGANLSDIAVGANGTVFASDPIGGGVYRLEPGSAALQALVPPGTLRSPQGLAESADGRWLYVSDYRYGLAAIELATGRVFRLATELPVLLDGIDALMGHGGELIAIQNGSSPMQIVALELGADGLSITGHRVLERAHPDWTEPLGAAIHEGRLYYVATGQWESFIEGGELAEGAELLPTKIRSLPLDRAEIAETP